MKAIAPQFCWDGEAARKFGCLATRKMATMQYEFNDTRVLTRRLGRSHAGRIFQYHECSGDLLTESLCPIRSGLGFLFRTSVLTMHSDPWYLARRVLFGECSGSVRGVSRDADASSTNREEEKRRDGFFNDGLGMRSMLECDVELQQQHLTRPAPLASHLCLLREGTKPERKKEIVRQGGLRSYLRGTRPSHEAAAPEKSAGAPNDM